MYHGQGKGSRQRLRVQDGARQVARQVPQVAASRGDRWRVRGRRGLCQDEVFHGTYSEAQDAKDEFVAAIERGEVRRERGMLFPAYAEAWLAERAAKVAYDTLQKNRCHIVCANMHLSKARIEEIRPGRTWMRCTRPSETARALQAGPCPEPTCATYP